MSNDSEAEEIEEETVAETGTAADAETEPEEQGADAGTGTDSRPEAAGETAEGSGTEETEESGTEEAGEADESESEEADEAQEGLQDGDFVKLDYTARTVEGGDLVDTTDPEVAEEEDVDADREFEPRTIVLGEGHIFPSVEDDIVGKEVGETGTVVVPASEAFGERDEEEVRTVSKDKIPEDDRYPGAQVQVDGQDGFVETIIGGRARVDFNHPLAGADIEYEYEIVDEIVDRVAKAEGLLKTRLDLDLDVRFQTDTVEEERLVEDDEGEDGDEAEDADEEEAEEGEGEGQAEEEGEEEKREEPEYETVEVEKESLYIEATPMLNMNQQWMIQKQEIAQDLIDFLGIDRVVVQEVLEGTGGMGMPGMMGGMGGMGDAGGAGDEELEAALDEADIDADELVEELEES